MYIQIDLDLTERIIVHHNNYGLCNFTPFGTEFIQNCCFDQLGPGLQPNNVHTLYENSTKLTLKAKQSHQLLFTTISRLGFDFGSVCCPELFKFTQKVVLDSHFVLLALMMTTP